MEPHIQPTNAPCPGQDVGLRHGWMAPHPGVEIFFGDLSIFLRQPVNSDSIRPSCQRIAYNLHTLKMAATGRVIRCMPDYTQKPLAQPTALHGPNTQPGRA